MMKKNNAVIGGEGNGGVIYPDAHYGRDSLVGIVLFLNLLAEKKVSLLELKSFYPQYFMSKNKLQLLDNVSFENIKDYLCDYYKNELIDLVDGLKIDFKDSWVQLRTSNTEPIIRVYSESKSQSMADDLSSKVISLIKSKFY